MRIDQFHANRIAADPEYAEAVKLVTLTEDFADLVVRMRLKAGITQTELAQRASTTQAVISRLENGEGNPSAELIGRVVMSLIIGKTKPAEAVARQGPQPAAASLTHFDAFRGGWLVQWQKVVVGNPKPTANAA